MVRYVADSKQHAAHTLSTSTGSSLRCFLLCGLDGDVISSVDEVFGTESNNKEGSELASSSFVSLETLVALVFLCGSEKCL